MMAMHHNFKRDSRYKPEPFTSLDFMNYQPREPEKVFTPEELELQLDRIFR